MEKFTMTLDPALAPLLAMMAPLREIDYATATAAQVRRLFDQPMAFGEPIAMARVEDIHADLLHTRTRMRLYVPTGAPDTPPITLFFHGGGWVIGTIETHDGICRRLAQESSGAVISVDYRLAPEHRYPGAIDDCYAALCWVSENAKSLGVDASRLAVAGDSAGGNLAIATALLARDNSGPELCHQLLIYPAADTDFDRRSYERNGQGDYVLSKAAMQWFWDQYLGDTPADVAPLAAVLRHPDLSHLPSTTIITAEFDPLVDEGSALGQRLIEAGVTVDAHCASGLIHGFFGMAEVIPSVGQWTALAAQNLARSFK
jgi:acetyl esterase